MTSKTFKGFASDRDLTVRGAEDGSQVDLLVRRATGMVTTGIAIAPSDAPALALAILEAAGYKEHSKANLGSSELLASYGMTKLRQAVQAQVREESETKAQSELEAEALELLNAFRSANDDAPVESFENFSINKPGWIRVAQHLREKRAEK